MLRTRSTPTAVSVLTVAVVLGGCAAGAPDDDGAGGVISVTATDDACTADVEEIERGTWTVDVSNEGSTVTEVYVYGEGDTVVGEVEDVTPGVERSFEIEVGGGRYEIACKPGMTGDGIRTPLVVAGPAAERPDPDTTVDVTAVDTAFEDVDVSDVDAGDTVAFTLVNEGDLEHEFEVFGPDGEVLGEVGPTDAGDSGEVVLTLEEPGTYRYVCGIDDHEDKGMVGEFELAAG